VHSAVGIGGTLNLRSLQLSPRQPAQQSVTDTVTVLKRHIRRSAVNVTAGGGSGRKFLGVAGPMEDR